MSFYFGTASKKELKQLHPLLVEIANDAIKVIDFRILDSSRGYDEQMLAYKKGTSKAKFGESAHNWTPAIAMDLLPAPYDWDDMPSFLNMGKVVMAIAKKRNIPLRWGGDWNMDGKTTDGWDFPHFELNPWRSFAAKCKPYKG